MDAWDNPRLGVTALNGCDKFSKVSESFRKKKVVMMQYGVSDEVPCRDCDTVGVQGRKSLTFACVRKYDQYNESGCGSADI